MLASTPIEE